MPSYTPKQFADHLAALPIAETIAAELETAASTLADAVRDALSTSPGSPHETPWLETGDLRASIDHVADGSSAAVGSNDPAAAPQELGTARLPPRPFLAPTASAHAEAIANHLGAAVAALFSR